MADLALEMILAATQGRLLGEAAPAVFPGASIDTRTLAAGELFVALQAERDGHDYVAQAFSRGAGAALVSREIAAKGPKIVVADTLQALGAIAAAHRNALDLRVIAITGSVGKTTVKDMLAAILEQGWRTLKSRGNYNTEIGVPLTLLELEASHQAAVVELAMRGRGQIAYLARMARPQVGVVTKIGLSHLELLGSKDAIAESKAELVEALPADGAAVLNADDEYFEVLAARSAAPVVSFGMNDGADVRVSEVEVAPDGRLRVRLTGHLIEAEIICGAVGRHHALNIAAAAAAVVSAGAPAEWVAMGLAAYATGEMRGRIVEAPGGYTVVDDSYNAAPDSMRAALELLADLPGHRKWAVLGDMKELGDASLEAHHELGRSVAKAGLTGLVTVGELSHHIAEGAREVGLVEVTEATDNATAAELLAPRLATGDVVLVKGSRAMHMEEIVAALLGREGDGHG